MRSVDILINICNEISNNGHSIENENKLIDFIYELTQNGIEIPSYNWTLSYGGITSQELKNDIHKLKFFKIIEQKSNKIGLVENNIDKVKNILNELDSNYKDKINNKINEILKNK